MKQNITENRKKYLKEYYLKNKEKQKKASYNQYRRNKGLNMDNSGLQVKKGRIIVDFN